MALRLMDVVEMVPALVDRLMLSARMLCLIQTCRRLRDLMSSEMLDGVSQARARRFMLSVTSPESKSLGRRARAQGACVPVTHVPRCLRAAGVLVGSVPAAKAEPDHARRQAHEVLALQGVCDAPEGAGVKHDGGTLYIALQCIRFAPAL
jgi:hypothetical protein